MRARDAPQVFVSGANSHVKLGDFGVVKSFSGSETHVNGDAALAALLTVQVRRGPGGLGLHLRDALHSGDLRLALRNADG